VAARQEQRTLHALCGCSHARDAVAGVPDATLGPLSRSPLAHMLPALPRDEGDAAARAALRDRLDELETGDGRQTREAFVNGCPTTRA
jgi:hypothetical protein